MSDDYDELVRKALDAFNRRDRAAFLATCDPEVENVPPRDWPESEAIRGRESVWDFFVIGNEPWAQGDLVPVEFIDAGTDKVVAHIRGDMLGTTSGATVTWSFWIVITVRNGSALRFEWFSDRVEALAAAASGPSSDDATR
jgi:ketosteroid isomerase-like protein